jgi:hypothetical protein
MNGSNEFQRATVSISTRWPFSTILKLEPCDAESISIQKMNTLPFIANTPVSAPLSNDMPFTIRIPQQKRRPILHHNSPPPLEKA